MIQILYIFTSLMGLLYFYLTLRKLNYFHVAYFSSVIYFLPGWFGYTSYHVNAVWIHERVHDDVYIVMIMVLASIFISGLVYSLVLQKQSSWGKTLSGEKYLPWVLLFFALSGLAGTVYEAWGYITQPDKPLLMQHLGRSHIVFYISSSLGFVLALSERRKMLAILFLVLLLFDVYLGFRSTLAVALIGGIMIWIRHSSINGKFNLRRISAVVLVTGAVFFVYKQVAYSIKSGQYSLVLEKMSDSETYTNAVTHSEPFITQAILNSVIRTNYEGGVDSLSSTACQLLPVGGNSLGECVGFNQLFQPVLFPEVTYGMASNIWAQMWSAGGLPAVGLFLLFYSGSIFVANFSLTCRTSAVKYGLVPALIYWTFYIHRNDLSYTLNLEKRVVIVLVLSTIISMFIATLSVDRINRRDNTCNT